MCVSGDEMELIEMTEGDVRWFELMVRIDLWRESVLKNEAEGRWLVLLALRGGESADEAIEFSESLR